MNLPGKIKFRPLCFSRLGNGGHMQERRNDEFGITHVSIKKDRNSEWEYYFKVDRFHGRRFKNGTEVIEAFKKLP